MRLAPRPRLARPDLLRAGLCPRADSRRGRLGGCATGVCQAFTPGFYPGVKSGVPFQFGTRYGPIRTRGVWRDAGCWNFSGNGFTRARARSLELSHRFGPIITDDFTWASCALELARVWTALHENQSKYRIAHIPLKVGCVFVVGACVCGCLSL